MGNDKRCRTIVGSLDHRMNDELGRRAAARAGELVQSLARLRKEVGIDTQARLADLLGVSPSAVSHFESLRAHPRLDRFVLWTQTCDADVRIVRRGSEAVDALPPDDAQLLQWLRKLEEADQRDGMGRTELLRRLAFGLQFVDGQLLPVLRASADALAQVGLDRGHEFRDHGGFHVNVKEASNE